MLVMITHDTLSSDSSKPLPVTRTDALAIATIWMSTTNYRETNQRNVKI